MLEGGPAEGQETRERVRGNLNWGWGWRGGGVPGRLELGRAYVLARGVGV